MSSLQFQDFNVGSGLDSVNSTNTDFRPAGEVGDRAELFVNGPETEEGRASRKSNFFSFEYYQQFFDVDTDQVASRIMNSMIPRFNANFIRDHIQPTPDLYGPFWVCVTLVFTTAILGNVARYVQTSGQLAGEYGSDFRVVTGTSTLLACYVILMPFLLYSVFWYRRCDVNYTYLEILCAYGYSLSIFVPASILWLVPIMWLKWLLVLICVALSSAVLVGSIWPAVKSDPNKMVALAVLVLIVLMQVVVAVSFMHSLTAVANVRASSDDGIIPHVVPSAEHSNLPQEHAAAVSDSKKSEAAMGKGSVAEAESKVANMSVSSAKRAIPVKSQQKESDSEDSGKDPENEPKKAQETLEEIKGAKPLKVELNTASIVANAV